MGLSEPGFLGFMGLMGLSEPGFIGFLGLMGKETIVCRGFESQRNSYFLLPNS
jgi:hypothetical protein